jgi:hypothetical protein
MLPVNAVLPFWAALGTVLLLPLQAQARTSSSSSSSSSVAVTVNTTSTSTVTVSAAASTQAPPPRNGSEIYRAKFPAHNPKTPKFTNATHTNVNPLWKAAYGMHGGPAGKHHPHGNITARQGQTALPVGACAPGTPCVNGACCSKVG